MSWESRRGRGGYYTRSYRHNGKIVREYVGAGPDAYLAYQLDLELRQARAEQRNQELAAIAADCALDQLHDRFDELVNAILKTRGRDRR